MAEAPGSQTPTWETWPDLPAPLGHLSSDLGDEREVHPSISPSASETKFNIKEQTRHIGRTHTGSEPQFVEGSKLYLSAQM